MGDVQISFQIDIRAIEAYNSQNSDHGSFGQPASYPGNPGHPNLRVTRNGRSAGAHPGDLPPSPHGDMAGDTAIWIPQNSDVMIWCEDAQGRANISVAIVRMALHRWTPGPAGTQQASSNVTLQTMNSDNSAPLTSAFFSSSAPRHHGLEYVDQSSSNWQNSSENFLSSWGGVNSSRNSQQAHPRQFHPHVGFQTQDNQGTLTYGVEFSVLIDGTTSGYFWFDPTIFIMDH